MLSILQARQRLRGRIRRTPLVRSAWLSRVTGAQVWLKLECHQATHAFKIRGAMNAVLELVARGERPDVVTASTGNHGRALAEAATASGLRCTVFTPHDTPPSKTAAIAAAGATLDATSTGCDAAEEAARAHARATGALYLSAYNHPAIVAGAGTIGLEIVEDCPAVDLVVVPLGGGGLASGVATAVKTISPACRIAGVEAALNPVFRAARAHGRITPVAVGSTLADGLSGNLEPGSITFPIINCLVDDLLEVSEADIASGIVSLLGEERLVVEGAGAVGAAAVASGLIDSRPRHIVVIVSGGNIEATALANLVTGVR